MADFKTHVTFSSAIGAGYAVIGSGMGFDLTTSLVAGGLCGVSGMLPDVDSDSGVPRREALGFMAAIVPMLLVDRFRQFNLSHDQMILLAAGLYFGIRFSMANLIGRWSVHRGMWHSIPAVLIFAGLAFLITGSTDIFVRYFKAIAVGLGAMSHLVLDEVYSVDTRGVVPKFKKSFGTAVKMWGKDPWANFSTYGKLALVAVAILMEPAILSRIELRNPQLADKVRGYKERLAQLPSPTMDSPLAISVEKQDEPVRPTSTLPAAPFPTLSHPNPARTAPATIPQTAPRTPPPRMPRGELQGFLPNRTDAAPPAPRY